MLAHNVHKQLYRYVYDYIFIMEPSPCARVDPTRPAARQHRAGTELAEPRWDALLPAEWRDAVDIPLYFRSYSEYEIRAQRSVGYDADDQPCFTTYSFALTRLVSDDDEEFYEEISCSEQLAAWRLRDERWLVFRRFSSHLHQQPRGFYAISPEMPR